MTTASGQVTAPSKCGPERPTAARRRAGSRPAAGWSYTSGQSWPVRQVDPARAAARRRPCDASTSWVPTTAARCEPHRGWQVTRVMVRCLAFTPGWPATGASTSVAVGAEDPRPRHLVDQPAVDGLDDDLVADRELVEVGEGFAVGGAVAGDGEVADLAGHRGLGEVARARRARSSSPTPSTTTHSQSSPSAGMCSMPSPSPDSGASSFVGRRRGGRLRPVCGVEVVEQVVLGRGGAVVGPHQQVEDEEQRGRSPSGDHQLGHQAEAEPIVDLITTCTREMNISSPLRRGSAAMILEVRPDGSPHALWQRPAARRFRALTGLGVGAVGHRGRDATAPPGGCWPYVPTAPTRHHRRAGAGPPPGSSRGPTEPTAQTARERRRHRAGGKREVIVRIASGPASRRRRRDRYGVVRRPRVDGTAAAPTRSTTDVVPTAGEPVDATVVGRRLPRPSAPRARTTVRLDVVYLRRPRGGPSPGRLQRADRRASPAAPTRHRSRADRRHRRPYDRRSARPPPPRSTDGDRPAGPRPRPRRRRRARERDAGCPPRRRPRRVCDLAVRCTGRASSRTPGRHRHERGDPARRPACGRRDRPGDRPEAPTAPGVPMSMLGDPAIEVVESRGDNASCRRR